MDKDVIEMVDRLIENLLALKLALLGGEDEVRARAEKLRLLDERRAMTFPRGVTDGTND